MRRHRRPQTQHPARERRGDILAICVDECNGRRPAPLPPPSISGLCDLVHTERRAAERRLPSSTQGVPTDAKFKEMAMKATVVISKHGTGSAAHAMLGRGVAAVAALMLLASSA